MNIIGKIVALGAACSALPVSAQETEITMYSFYNSDRTFYEEMVADYEKANPDVSVRMEFFENSAYDAALRAAFASGQVPDLISVEPDARSVGMYPLIEADLLEPLNDLYEQEKWDETFFDSVLTQLNVDGKYYSAPVSVNNFSLFYNATILEEYGLTPPQSYEDLLHMAEVLKPDGIYPIAFADQFPQRGRDHFYMIAGQLESQIVKQADAGDIPWTDERLVRATQRMKDMADEGIFMPGINAMSIPQGDQAFLTGRAAMVLSGPWSIGPYSVGAPEGMDVAVMQFPPVFEEGTSTSPGGVGKNYAIPKAGNVEAAKHFLAYFLSEPTMTKYVDERNVIAPYASANKGVTNPLQLRFIENQSSGVVPRVLLSASMLEALGNALQGVFADEITPQEAMQEVEDAR